MYSVQVVLQALTLGLTVGVILGALGTLFVVWPIFDSYRRAKEVANAEILRLKGRTPPM